MSDAKRPIRGRGYGAVFVDCLGACFGSESFRNVSRTTNYCRGCASSSGPFSLAMTRPAEFSAAADRRAELHGRFRIISRSNRAARGRNLN